MTSPARLAPSLLALFAIGSGLSAASLYYNQPILGAIHATHGQIGIMPMLTQLGYAVGILLFAPLGDRLDRRDVIVAKLWSRTKRSALVRMAGGPKTSPSDPHSE